MSAPEPLREEKPVSKPPSKPSGGESQATGRKKASAGADLAPGGAADMATAPDADGRLAKLDPIAILDVAGALENHAVQLAGAYKDAHKADVATFLWAFARVGDVAHSAGKQVRRLDGLLGGMTPEDFERMSKPREKVMAALRKAREARDKLNRALSGPTISPPKDVDEAVLLAWKVSSGSMFERLNALAGSLGASSKLFVNAADLDKRIQAAREQAAKEKAAEQKAADGGKKGGGEAEKAPPEKTAAEKAPQENAPKVSDPKHDASANLGGGLVKADADFVAFKRARFRQAPGGGIIEVVYVKGGKEKTTTIGSVREAEFQDALAAGFSRDDAADEMADRLVATLRTRWKQFDVHENDYAQAKLAIAEAVKKSGSNQHRGGAL